MGNSCSCMRSSGGESASPSEKSLTLLPKGQMDIERDGHAGGLQNGDVKHALKEAKELLSEVRRKSSQSSGKDSPEMAAEMANLVSRLEMAVGKLERLGDSVETLAPVQQNSAPGGQSQASSTPFVAAYEDLLSSAVQVFLEFSRQIGGDVEHISKLVDSLFATQKAFLAAAALSQKPSDSDLAKALEPTGRKIQEVINYRETHRTSPLFNHLSAISESISGLSWVAITPAPGPYVKEMGEAAMFYTNRVLKDFRDKDKIHVDWVQHWNNIFKELQAYIKSHHTTGVTWNPRGVSLLSVLKTPSDSGVPPPPPPGGIPPPPPMVNLNIKAPADDGREKLFDELNKGLDITCSLKKVPDHLKTHKNPSLREGPKPFVKASAGDHFSAPPTQKPPRIALEGKKWFVEYQKDATNLVLDNCKMEHAIYIFKCENTVVQVKGKVNSIILDSCKKTSVVYDNLVSACEIVNCQSCQMQVMGKVATVSIEKTDGCQVYLSPESVGVEIITAKSSEMNILIPKGDGDFTECPVPEQFKTTILGQKLHTIVMEKA